MTLQINIQSQSIRDLVLEIAKLQLWQSRGRPTSVDRHVDFFSEFAWHVDFFSEFKWHDVSSRYGTNIGMYVDPQ